VFEEIDSNSDRLLTKDELTHWFVTKRGLPDLPENLWEDEDTNEDGYISWDEFKGPKGQDQTDEL